MRSALKHGPALQNQALRSSVSASYSTESNPTSAYPIIDHTYDALVVGAGGAGLRAAIGLSGMLLKLNLC